MKECIIDTKGEFKFPYIYLTDRLARLIYTFTWIDVQYINFISFSHNFFPLGLSQNIFNKLKEYNATALNAKFTHSPSVIKAFFLSES